MIRALFASIKRIAATPSTVRGMGWMLISAFTVAIFNGIVRHLSADVHPFEIAFVHSAFGVLYLTPVYVRSGLASLKTRHFAMHALRATLNVTASLSMIMALSISPLAEVAALSFSAPLFATILAVALLGERMRARRITALVVGFAGTWLVFRPGIEAIEPGSLLVLGFAVAWGGAMIAVKALARTESSLTQTLYLGLLNTPMAALAAIPVWQTPSLGQLAWLAGLGAVGVVRQLSMSQAFKEANATAILPLDFTKLIWVAIIGYAAFAEIPTMWTWAGGFVIFVATTYITVREGGLSRTESGKGRRLGR
ncbi:MAG: DMT family transporter [Rhodospirillales bacterium]|nr:DMT family transporter [Rhodospirillales bacterium]